MNPKCSSLMILNLVLIKVNLPPEFSILEISLLLHHQEFLNNPYSITKRTQQTLKASSMSSIRWFKIHKRTILNLISWALLNNFSWWTRRFLKPRTRKRLTEDILTLKIIYQNKKTTSWSRVTTSQDSSIFKQIYSRYAAPFWTWNQGKEDIHSLMKIYWCNILIKLTLLDSCKMKTYWTKFLSSKTWSTESPSLWTTPR